MQIWCISSVLLRSVHFQVNLLLGFDTFLQTFADVHLHKWFFCELFVHVVWPNENSVLFEGLLCRDIVSELFCALGKENWLEVCLTEVKLLSILLKLVLLLEEVSLHQNVRVACQSWNWISTISTFGTSIFWGNSRVWLIGLFCLSEVVFDVLVNGRKEEVFVLVVGFAQSLVLQLGVSVYCVFLLVAIHKRMLASVLLFVQVHHLCKNAPFQWLHWFRRHAQRILLRQSLRLHFVRLLQNFLRLVWNGCVPSFAGIGLYVLGVGHNAFRVSLGEHV